MKYVMIEGNRQKSEAKFWRRLIDFVLDPSVNLLCAEGSSKFKEALTSYGVKYNEDYLFGYFGTGLSD